MSKVKAMIVLAALTLVVSVVAGAASAAKTADGTIVDVAAGNKRFSTLVSLVQAAGLAGALSDTDAQLTVFAPTNAAFKSLEKAVPGVTDALLDPANKKLLVQVLKYHVVAGEIKSPAAVKAAKAKAKVPTLLGKNANGRLWLSLSGGKIRIADSAGLNKATVIAADVDASNGVIHVIDRVVVPKSVAMALKKAGLLP